ncbi:MAG TPA: hypothetical protein VE196_04005 [Pseudonocardiaceae bacterium]|nr:hypothetical protein [Pseudonocardiaceae bacterium]
MPTSSRSESDNDPGSGESTARAGVAGTVGGEGSGRAVAAWGGFGLPLPGGLAAVMDPQRLLWLGGLGAVVALGVIEWPVAVAIGVGSYAAERFAREDVRRDLGQRS